MQTTRTPRPDRVLVRPGASSGFGASVSLAVLERGQRLVATARKLDAIESLAAEFPERALALRLDVTDTDAARKAVDQAFARFGRVDVIFTMPAMAMSEPPRS